jgi:hypothetical protein
MVSNIKHEGEERENLLMMALFYELRAKHKRGVGLKKYSRKSIS